MSLLQMILFRSFYVRLCVCVCLDNKTHKTQILNLFLFDKPIFNLRFVNNCNISKLGNVCEGELTNEWTNEKCVKSQIGYETTYNRLNSIWTQCFSTYPEYRHRIVQWTVSECNRSVCRVIEFSWFRLHIISGEPSRQNKRQVTNLLWAKLKQFL